MAVLTDLRNRGVRDMFFLVCDGAEGAAGGRGEVWPETIVQTCLVHLVRNTYRPASKRDWDAVKACDPDLRRGQRRRGLGGVRRAGRTVAAALPGDHPAMGQRVGHLHPGRRLRSLSQNLVLVRWRR